MRRMIIVALLCALSYAQTGKRRQLGSIADENAALEAENKRLMDLISKATVGEKDLAEENAGLQQTNARLMHEIETAVKRKHQFKGMDSPGVQGKKSHPMERCQWGDAKANTVTDGVNLYADQEQNYDSDVKTMILCQEICEDLDDCTGVTYNSKLQRCFVRSGASKLMGSSKQNLISSVRICKEVVYKSSQKSGTSEEKSGGSMIRDVFTLIGVGFTIFFIGKFALGMTLNREMKLEYSEVA